MNMNINMNMNMNMNAPSENSGAWVCDGWDNLGAMATAGGRVADWDWEGASGAGNSLFLPTRRCCSPEEDTKPHIVAATPPTPALRQYAAGAGLGFPGAGIHLNSGVFPSPLGHLAPTAFHGGLGGGFSDVSGFGGGGGAFSGEPSSSRSQFLGSHGIHELVVKQEEMCAGDFHAAARIGLNLGHRTYFSSEDHGMGRIYRRPRALPPASQVPRCQAEGCKADLSNAKHYHRRHKVCEFHSKATSVIAGGVQQRFCQQCSRFHVLAEFDEVKRSCRKRLADHNRRRRKPHPTSSTSAAAAGSVPPPPQASSSSNSANKPENDDRSSGAAPANCSSAASARGLQSCTASARTEAQPVMNAIPLPLMSTNSSAAAGIGTQQKSAAARAVAATGPSLSLSSSSSGMSPSPCKALATAVTQQQDLSGLELALPWLRRSTSSDYGATASSRGHRQQSHRSFEILQQQQQQPLLSDKAATVESLNFLPLTTREWMLGSKDRNRHSQSQQMFSLMDSRTATDEDSAVQEHHQPQPVEYLSHHRLSSKRDMEQQHHGGKIPDGFRGFGSSIYDAASHL